MPLLALLHTCHLLKQLMPFHRSVRRDLIGPLVEKGLNSSRTSTKAQSLESLVEIAVKDGTSVLFVSFGCRILFQDALSELLTHKNAKVVACAISAASSIIQELGTTHAQCKGLLSSLSRLFSETDKGVRAEVFPCTNIQLSPSYWQRSFIDGWAPR